MGIGRLAALAVLIALPAQAQDVPADLTALPAPAEYAPPRTSWGDPDLTGTWPLEQINQSGISFQRPEEYGARVWLTDEEFAKRLARAEASDAAYDPDNARGSVGLADWVRAQSVAHRTSMLVSPADGRLPAMTAEAQALFKAGRSSWVPDQTYDWVDDFDPFDRCISRGMPASMLPFRYNNGIQIFQSPGFVVIHFEMLGDRLIPLRGAGHWPSQVESWLGSSVGHWEGDTLVVETANIHPGDNATRDVVHRAASPINQQTQGAPPFNSIPISAQAKVAERFILTGPDSLTYELTYSDPQVFTAPWTARIDWTRDDKYQLFEYACHEGNVQIRNYITASRRRRAAEAAGLPPAGQ
ncbi:MAG: hypothetical protein P0Y56_05035 [Candidatus Andeanibacterium colombiense]|uniref:Uncharacterized protein n=1 Tax=Candidatus Andeanibacterium colombiense TaxID=3121345 RepID=A0AAJ5X845_9SPHN|nr:MAG: hypothetical protein P0Y56_05035 [Sphingomonadaceae bacterium]